MTRIQQSYETWVGQDAYDPNGEKIGEINDIFYDEISGRPEWVAIKTGFFGTKTTLVPLQASRADDRDNLVLNYTKDQIKNAPNFDPTYDDLTSVQERSLWSHYGYNYDADPTSTDFGYGEGYAQQRADDDFSWDAPSMGERMTESSGGRTEHKADQVRLQRYVVQETKNVEVPIQREEVRVERDN